MYRVAYLPCELRGRDLEARLLIASHLLRHNIPVVIGQVWALAGNARAKFNIPGCYLFATANSSQAKAMTWAKDAGHVVLASDEEALPLINPLKNVTHSAVEACDKFLVDTYAHLTTLVDAFGNENKFSVVGSPRLETIHTSNIEPINGSPYILFNTGFGVINSVWGDPGKALEIMHQAAPLTSEEAQLIVDAEKASFEIMKSILTWLCPRFRIVIRPHPSERVQTWRNGFPHAEIIEGSSSLSWIKGAKATIHSNSTTGLEAAILGVPTLNINPIEKYGEKYILTKINYSVASAPQAIHAIEKFLQGKMELNGSTVPHEIFVPDGAKNTAQKISDSLGQAQAFSGDFPWAPMERNERQRLKFSASRDDIVQSSSLAEVEIEAIYELDDSVFLLVPS